MAGPSAAEQAEKDARLPSSAIARFRTVEILRLGLAFIVQRKMPPVSPIVKQAGCLGGEILQTGAIFSCRGQRLLSDGAPTRSALE